MFFTVQLVAPCTRSDAPSPVAPMRSEGAYVHQLAGNAVVMDVCLAELERLSAARNSTSVAAWREAQPSTKRARLESDVLHGPWRLDADTMRELGVPGVHGQVAQLPAPAMLMLQVYPWRLRNESSAKFLDWWSRKGSALPAAAPSAPPPGTVAAEHAMVPQHVLDQVSQLRADDTDAVESPWTAAVHQHYVQVPPAMRLDTLLRSLPAEYGVVEHAVLMLWPKDALSLAVRRGQVTVLPLMATAQAATPAPRSELTEPAPRREPTEPPPANTAPTGGPAAAPAASGLVAYATDSDDEA